MKRIKTEAKVKKKFDFDNIWKQKIRFLLNIFFHLNKKNKRKVFCGVQKKIESFDRKKIETKRNIPSSSPAVF